MTEEERIGKVRSYGIKTAAQIICSERNYSREKVVDIAFKALHSQYTDILLKEKE